MSKITFLLVSAGLLLSVESTILGEEGIYQAGKQPVALKKGAEKLANRKEKKKDEKESKADKGKDKKEKSIADLTKGDKKIEGLFTLFQNTTNGSVQVLIKESQLNKEY